MATESKFKLDIFWLLKELDRPYYNIWESLTEDQQKGFAPVVVMRWLAGTSSEEALLKLNDRANGKIFQLGKHPELLMKLLHSSCIPRTGRRQWLAASSAKKKRASIISSVVEQYLDMSPREVNLLNPFPDADEVIRMAEEIGLPEDEFKKLKKELK